MEKATPIALNFACYLLPFLSDIFKSQVAGKKKDIMRPLLNSNYEVFISTPFAQIINVVMTLKTIKCKFAKL